MTEIKIISHSNVFEAWHLPDRAAIWSSRYNLERHLRGHEMPHARRSTGLATVS